MAYAYGARITDVLDKAASRTLEVPSGRTALVRDRSAFAVDLAVAILAKLDDSARELSRVLSDLDACLLARGSAALPPRVRACCARPEQCTPCRSRRFLETAQTVSAKVRAILEQPRGAERLLGADRLAKSGRMVDNLGTQVRSVAAELEVALRLGRLGEWTGWRHHSEMSPFERRFGDATQAKFETQEVDVVALSRTLLVEVKHIAPLGAGTSTFDNLAAQLLRYDVAREAWEQKFRVRPRVLVVFSSGFTVETQRALLTRCGCESCDLEGIADAIVRMRCGTLPHAAVQPVWRPCALVARLATRQREQRGWLIEAVAGMGDDATEPADVLRCAAAAAATERMADTILGVCESVKSVGAPASCSTETCGSGSADITTITKKKELTPSTPYLLNQVSSAAYLNRLYAAVAIELLCDECRPAPLVPLGSDDVLLPPKQHQALPPMNLCAETVPYLVSDFWHATEESLARERRIKEVILADGSTLRSVSLNTLRALLLPARAFLLGTEETPRRLLICRAACADFESYLQLRGSETEQERWCAAKGTRIEIIDDTPLAVPLRDAALRFSSPTGFTSHRSDPSMGHTAQTGFTFEEALGAGDANRAVTAVSQLWTLAELGPFTAVVYLVDCGLHASLRGELIPNQPKSLTCRTCGETKLSVGFFSISQVKKAMRREVAERLPQEGGSPTMSGRALTRSVGRHPHPIIRDESERGGSIYDGGITKGSAGKAKGSEAICIACELDERAVLAMERARRRHRQRAQQWRSLTALLSDRSGGGSHARRHHNAAIARFVITRLLDGATLREALRNKPRLTSSEMRRVWEVTAADFSAARGASEWEAAQAAARSRRRERVALENQRDAATVECIASLWSGVGGEDENDDEAW